MIVFDDKLYEELAIEITKQAAAGGDLCCGVVELAIGSKELLFGFDLAQGFLQQWCTIGFEDGHRCGVEFNIDTLLKWL